MLKRPCFAFFSDCIVVAFCLLLTVTTGAASFPCDKAKSVIEKMICSQPELSDLDEYMGRYYWAARDYLHHADACMVSDQRAWLKTTRDRCEDAACLTRAYLNRLAILDALQPGVTRLRNIELPKVAPLVWIVPPASDQVAAPRNGVTVPLVVKGKILNEIVTGDGFVLLSDDKKFLIVSAMLLESPTDQTLASFAQDSDARYELVGRTDIKGNDGRPFASGQCTYVYRVSP